MLLRSKSTFIFLNFSCSAQLHMKFKYIFCRIVNVGLVYFSPKGQGALSAHDGIPLSAATDKATPKAAEARPSKDEATPAKKAPAKDDAKEAAGKPEKKVAAKEAKPESKKAQKESKPRAKKAEDDNYVCSLCGLQENHPKLGLLNGPYEEDRDGEEIWYAGPYEYVAGMCDGKRAKGAKLFLC